MNNVAPTITSPSMTSYLAQIGTVITGTGAFKDPGTLDTFTAYWNWDDGATDSLNLPAGTVSTTDDHIYNTPGVYTANLKVVDDDNGEDSEYMSHYVVIYDPTGGFVTGGGWIESPAGAYLSDPSLEGRVNFGFVSKYKPGTTVPTGQAEIQFQVANFNFH
ncbi:MAG TPA: PKD domain-containing protein [Candidatus Methanoperedens sp.]